MRPTRSRSPSATRSAPPRASRCGDDRGAAMIAMLRGVLVDKGIDHVLVDVGGVGYRVAVSLNTLAALPPVGATATVHTEL
ncbi:MAG TPA: OB-fold domain-containing protein, partial [Polyangia bacterium]